LWLTQTDETQTDETQTDETQTDETQTDETRRIGITMGIGCDSLNVRANLHLVKLQSQRFLFPG